MPPQGKDCSTLEWAVADTGDRGFQNAPFSPAPEALGRNLPAVWAKVLHCKFYIVLSGRSPRSRRLIPIESINLALHPTAYGTAPSQWALGKIMSGIAQSTASYGFQPE